MTKKNWNNFVEMFPQSPGCVTKVSSSLPKKAKRLDAKGKVLPTPYGLLTGWLKKNLNGDWASLTKGGVVLVRVCELADLELIQHKFGFLNGPNKTDVSPETYQFGYTDSGYGKLAADMGYSI